MLNGSVYAGQRLYGIVGGVCKTVGSAYVGSNPAELEKTRDEAARILAAWQFVTDVIAANKARGEVIQLTGQLEVAEKETPADAATFAQARPEIASRRRDQHPHHARQSSRTGLPTPAWAMNLRIASSARPTR
jgi:hypothetical protein